MKLAEALAERSDIRTRISALQSRLAANARVQEGERPAEDPKALMAEAEALIAREEELKAKTARLEELNALLNLDKREPEVMDVEPDENQRPPARPAAQMER